MATTMSNDKPALAPLGSLCSTHKVYQDPHKPNKWTTTLPEREEPPVENAESAQHALILRYKISESPGKEFDLHSIVVQSPHLKTVLARILDGYPGITLELERLEFDAPFECFVHRWKSLEEVMLDVGSYDLYEWEPEDLENYVNTNSHLEMLHSILETELAPTLHTKRDLLRNGVMTTQHAWTIFEPGCHIYTKKDGYDRLYKLGSMKWETQNKREVLKLDCEFIDYDGMGFGMSKETLTVSGWKGTKKITKLEAFPYMFHEAFAIMKNHGGPMPERDLDAEMEHRGRMFEAYAGFHFVAYKGIALGRVARGEAKFDVDSRIIIDSAASMRYNSKVNLEYIETKETSAGSPHTTAINEVTDDDDCVVLDRVKDKPPSSSSGKTPRIHWRSKSALTLEQLVITNNKVRGYSLRDKKWMSFFIDNIQDITWNEDAFDSLVAPQEQKDLVLAFAQAQSKTSIGFDDFIRGKGKGIIMLLTGPPGVGKTLTAESVAEAMKVPLYSIGAAELGTKPQELERKLEDILVMCAKWNAVLLLDEADVFMQSRGSGSNSRSLERNQLVAVFLRLLEYFEGLMFLTTNRLEQMDSAFESRIHLTLNYTELDKTSRRQIWSKFLTRNAATADITQFSDADLDKLAKVEMNGRQIKNVLKTAQLLAARYDEVMGMPHLETVLKLRKANEK